MKAWGLLLSGLLAAITTILLELDPFFMLPDPRSNGAVAGNFYGSGHEGVAGSLERNDLTAAAFGASRYADDEPRLPLKNPFTSKIINGMAKFQKGQVLV